MREDQADSIIKLLEDIRDTLKRVEYVTNNMESDVSDISYIKNDNRKILDLLTKKLK